jgi:uncharacterized membrane protein
MPVHWIIGDFTNQNYWWFGWFQFFVLKQHFQQIFFKNRVDIFYFTLKTNKWELSIMTENCEMIKFKLYNIQHLTVMYVCQIYGSVIFLKKMFSGGTGGSQLES